MPTLTCMQLLEGKSPSVPLLPQVRDDVERQVGDALQRTSEAEARLQQGRAQHAAALTAAHTAVADAERAAQEAQRREAACQRRLEDLTEDCSRCAP